ncbi:MAG TPA: hypothetical protein VLA62_06785 [Solirubrobacterales bacterium]|nr:hypothetical protein [Solirubrobacterales bacterium]
MLGSSKAAIRHRDGLQVDLRVVEPEAFGVPILEENEFLWLIEEA